MIFSYKTRKILFNVFGVIFLSAAAFHFVGLFYKINDAPLWRHAIFIGIDIFCAYGILKRPKYFVYFMLLFLIQQYFSHGYYLVKIWQEKKQIHWISIFDILLLPIVLICLVEDYRVRRK